MARFSTYILNIIKVGCIKMIEQGDWNSFQKNNQNWYNKKKIHHVLKITVNLEYHTTNRAVCNSS